MNPQSPCPAWCDGQHLYVPDTDAVHQVVLEPVPVVGLNRTISTDGAFACNVEATELEVAAYQYVGGDEVWVAVVEGEGLRQRVEISLESVTALTEIPRFCSSNSGEFR